MSIINEALKKTGQFIQENEAKSKPEDNGLPGNSQDNKPQAKISRAPKPLLVYILILLAGILLSKFIFAMLNHKPQNDNLAWKTQRPQSKEIRTIPPPTPTPTVVPASVLPPENNKVPEPKFILNGIFFSENNGYALVNNQIVRENDSVDGAKVIKITANTVELDSDGKLTSLSTRR